MQGSHRRTILEPIRLFKVLPFTAAVLILMVIGLALDSLSPALQLAGMGVCLLTIAAWLFRYLRRETIQLPLALIPIFLLWGYQSISILWSLNPIPAMQKSLIALLLVFVFVLTYDTMKKWGNPWTWFNAMLGLGIIVSAIELALYYQWLVRWWTGLGTFPWLPPVGYRLQGLLLGHANVTAGYLNLLLPTVFFKLTRSTRTADRIGWASLVILLGAVEYLASSRGGWLSGVLGVGLLIAYLLWDHFGEWENFLKVFKTNRKRILVIAVLCLIAALLIVAFLLIQVRKTGHAVGLGSRDYIWYPALAIIKEHWLFGAGWGSFSTLYAEQALIPPGFATSHAHNGLLQIWAEHGLVGVFLLLVVVGHVVHTFIRAFRNATPQSKPYIVLAFCSLATVVGHHFVDYLFESPLYTAGVFVWLAMLYRYSPERQSFKARGRIVGISGVLLLVSFTAFVKYSVPGSFNFYNGITTFRSGDITNAADDICLAAEQNPNFSFYWFQCGLSSAFLVDKIDSPIILDQAIGAYEIGLDPDPYWAQHWASLSALYWAKGDVERAFNSIDTAIQIAPRYSKYPQFKGYMYEMLNNFDGAIEQYSLALDIDPWLAFDPFFEGSGVRSEVAKSFRDAYPLSPQNELWGAWNKAFSGDIEIARNQLEQVKIRDARNPIVYTGLAEASLLSGDLTDALTQAKLALFIQPLNPVALRIAAQASSGLGMIENAFLYQKLFVASQIEGSQSWQYYNRTYLKYFIPPDTVPQFSNPLIGSIAGN